MSARKYHIGKNGPAPCNAHPERPGGRPCRLGGPDGTERHGSLEQVTAIWEREQEELHSDNLLSGLSRIESTEPAETSAESPEALEARRALSNLAKYTPSSTDVSYSKAERAIARNLALESLSALSHTAIAEEDYDWETDGFSSVHRYELTDGSAAYFKPFTMNSFEEGEYLDYGTTSLGASINEVNSYRMAQALGGGFKELVPETAFREIEGEVGTIQREVEESPDHPLSFTTVPELRDDYRKAAIFDFVVGSLDRHEGNYLYGLTVDERQNSRNSIRLIDNSFGFPDELKYGQLNCSTFASNGVVGGRFDGRGRWIEPYNAPLREMELRVDERSALAQAREAVQGWIAAKTIADGRGHKAIERIDHLLSKGRIGNLSDYFRTL